MSITGKNIGNISQLSNASLCEGNIEKYNQIVTRISPVFVLQGENVVEKSIPLNEVIKGKSSAVTFAVIENGKIDCVGAAGKQSDDPSSLKVTTNTMFLIASMTKTVVAYCTTQCLQEYAKRNNIPINKILDTSIDKFFPKVPTEYPFTEPNEISKEEITGTKAAKIIKEIYKKSPENLNPVQALALIAQFKAWAIYNNRFYIDINYVEELEKEILQKHEFLYGTLEVREALQRFVDKNLTFRELLSHSTGIIIDPAQITWFDFRFISSTKISIEHLRHATFTERKIPSTRRYSNTGYTLIECALESIMGKPLPEIVQEYVFIPLKMENSTIAYSGSNRSTIPVQTDR